MKMNHFLLWSSSQPTAVIMGSPEGVRNRPVILRVRLICLRVCLSRPLSHTHSRSSSFCEPSLPSFREIELGWVWSPVTFFGHVVLFLGGLIYRALALVRTM